MREFVKYYFQNHLNARINGNHYIRVELRESFPIPLTRPFRTICQLEVLIFGSKFTKRVKLTVFFVWFLLSLKKMIIPKMTKLLNRWAFFDIEFENSYFDQLPNATLNEGTPSLYN